MSRICRICLENVRGEVDYHARCLRALFGSAKVPHLDIELGNVIIWHPKEDLRRAFR